MWPHGQHTQARDSRSPVASNRGLAMNIQCDLLLNDEDTTHAGTIPIKTSHPPDHTRWPLLPMRDHTWRAQDHQYLDA